MSILKFSKEAIDARLVEDYLNSNHWDDNHWDDNHWNGNHWDDNTFTLKVHDGTVRDNESVANDERKINDDLAMYPEYNLQNLDVNTTATSPATDYSNNKGSNFSYNEEYCYTANNENNEQGQFIDESKMDNTFDYFGASDVNFSSYQPIRSDCAIKRIDSFGFELFGQETKETADDAEKSQSIAEKKRLTSERKRLAKQKREAVQEQRRLDKIKREAIKKQKQSDEIERKLIASQKRAAIRSLTIEQKITECKQHLQMPMHRYSNSDVSDIYKIGCYVDLSANDNKLKLNYSNDTTSTGDRRYFRQLLQKLSVNNIKAKYSVMCFEKCATVLVLLDNDTAISAEFEFEHSIIENQFVEMACEYSFDSFEEAFRELERKTLNIQKISFELKISLGRGGKCIKKMFAMEPRNITVAFLSVLFAAHITSEKNDKSKCILFAAIFIVFLTIAKHIVTST